MPGGPRERMLLENSPIAHQAPLRVPGEWNTVSRGKREYAKYGFGGSHNHCRIAQENTIMRNRELGARKAFSPMAELPHQRRVLQFRKLESPLAGLKDLARVAIVKAHPRGRLHRFGLQTG